MPIVAPYLPERFTSKVSPHRRFRQRWSRAHRVAWTARRCMRPASQKKDACDQGHLFTEENTYTHPKGMRACRTCRAGWNRDYRRRHRAVAD